MKQLPEPKKVTRKLLLALPHREWDKETTYDQIYLVPTGRLHDSGFGLIAVVGASRAEDHWEAEIAAICDDVCWTFPQNHPYRRIRPGVLTQILRSDCSRTGVLRMWASGEHFFRGRFRVGISVSSTEVELVLESAGKPNSVTGEM